MDSGYVGVGVEEDGDEVKRMGETHATMVLALYCWGPFGVDVYGKYTFGYVTDCMLNEVR